MVVNLILSKITKNTFYKICSFILHTIVHPRLPDFYRIGLLIGSPLITWRVHNNWQSNIIEDKINVDLAEFNIKLNKYLLIKYKSICQ